MKKDPLHICLVSAAYRPYPSGVSEHVYNLAKSLKELNQEITILTTKFPHFEPMQSKSPEPANVYRFGKALLVPMNLSYATLPFGVRLPAQVANFFKTHQFDIVHCHGLFWPEISYWALRYSRATNLITFLTAGFKIHKRGARIFRFLFRDEINKIHGKIAISRRAQAAIEPYLPGEYRIIPSGVDLRKFHPEVQPVLKKRPKEKVVLFVGRLDKRKGLEVLIQALPLVKMRVADVRLVAIGKGARERECRQLVKRLGLEDVVEFIGGVDAERLPGYYRSADVYCSPALGGETQGVVLLEAMACGVPVVASKIPGYDETIRDNIDGILFPLGDINALADCIVKVLTDEELRNRLIANGLKRVRDYAWPIIAKKTLDYYQELLAIRKQDICD